MQMKTIRLCNGVDMPIIGLGTFKVQGKEVIHKCLHAALAAGYRAIDTAAVYRNEADIGESLKILLPEFGLSRSDIFITSKLGPKDQGGGKCREACLKSLSNLQTDYLDLYLIHWPGTQGRKPDDGENVRLRHESWRDMEDLHKQGKIKCIGVSNYEERHLQGLMENCHIQPTVLQIEHHPHLVQTKLVEYCRQQNIHFQAYSSLGTTSDSNKLLNDETVKSLAEIYSKSPAQILLRWAVQQDIGVIPKSTNPDHIQANIDIFNFKLSDSDMDKLSNLNKDYHYCWNPGAVS